MVEGRRARFNVQHSCGGPERSSLWSEGIGVRTDAERREGREGGAVRIGECKSAVGKKEQESSCAQAPGPPKELDESELAGLVNQPSVSE